MSRDTENPELLLLWKISRFLMLSANLKCYFKSTVWVKVEDIWGLDVQSVVNHFVTSKGRHVGIVIIKQFDGYYEGEVWVLYEQRWALV